MAEEGYIQVTEYHRNRFVFRSERSIVFWEGPHNVDFHASVVRRKQDSGGGFVLQSEYFTLYSQLEDEGGNKINVVLSTGSPLEKISTDDISIGVNFFKNGKAVMTVDSDDVIFQTLGLFSQSEVSPENTRSFVESIASIGEIYEKI